MLLDYAAELKCVTQRQVVQTGVALVHLPSNLHQLIVSVTAQAQSLIHAIHAEITDIRHRKRQKARRQQQLSRTRQQLEKATRLIEQGNAAITQANSGDHIVTGSQSHADSDTDSDGDSVDGERAKRKVDALAEQIRLLKEQMAVLAELKQPDTPPAQDTETKHHADDVPLAPPMIASVAPRAHSRDVSTSFASIPIAAPMFSAPAPVIPVAPPMQATIPTPPPMTPLIVITADVPMAPPMVPISVAAEVPVAPPLAFDTPSTPTRSILADLSDHAQNVRATPSRSASKASKQPMPISLNDELLSARKLRPRPSNIDTPPAVSCYTRSIPGADRLSHTDLIKVAAKISLRRTEIPRSPGGTPARRSQASASAGADHALLASALMAKFKNVNRRSGGDSRASVANDKENWCTE